MKNLSDKYLGLWPVESLSLDLEALDRKVEREALEHTTSCDRVLLEIQVKTLLYSHPEKGVLSIVLSVHPPVIP